MLALCIALWPASKAALAGDCDLGCLGVPGVLTSPFPKGPLGWGGSPKALAIILQSGPHFLAFIILMLLSYLLLIIIIVREAETQQESCPSPL